MALTIQLNNLNVSHVLVDIFYLKIKNNVLKKSKIVNKLDFNVVQIYFLHVIKTVINAKYIVANANLFFIWKYKVKNAKKVLYKIVNIILRQHQKTNNVFNVIISFICSKTIVYSIKK